MNEQILDEKTVEAAMQIIMAAGNARLHCKAALDGVAEADFEKAAAEMKLAHEDILKAHQVQTDAIQAETRGEKKEYTLLFAHAQDTLMTVYSEINIAKQMIKIYNQYEMRLAALEASMAGLRKE